MSYDVIFKKLKEYKRKQHLNLLIKGLLICSTLFLLLFLISSVLEFQFNYGVAVRTAIFYILLVSLLASLASLVFRPVYHLLNVEAGLSDEQAAKEIGKFFPDVRDKLLNTIQLRNISSENSSLILASLNKRIEGLKTIPFAQAVDFSINKRYAYYFGGVLLVIVLTGLTIPQMLTESTERIVNHRKEYIPEAPFRYIFENESFDAFKNEDFDLKVRLEGKSIPENVYMISGRRKTKLHPLSDRIFGYTFQKIQTNVRFQLTAAGFDSEEKKIVMRSRPELSQFDVELDYPAYTKIKDERIVNAGNLTVAEGTIATWNIATSSADKATVIFDRKDTLISKETDNQIFTTKRKLRKQRKYEISLQNEHSKNRDQISYDIQIIKDQYPTISAEYYADTVLFEYLVIAGNIGDDYGISNLTLNYNRGNKDTKKRRAIPFNKRQSEQTYYLRWELDSLNLVEGEKLEVFVEVKDNDGVNGAKGARSKLFSFKMPNKKELESSLSKKSEKTQEKINESLQSTEKINEKLKELEERLRSKKEMEWQEEKLLQDILKQREEIEKSINELKKEFDELRKGEDKFQKRSEPLKEKAKQLQKLMEEVLDEETKKLYDELQKILEDKKDIQDVRDQLDKIAPKEEDLEKELERALELFKRLKVENELEKTSNKLEELAKKQEDLARENESKASDQEEVQKKQEEIKEQFEEVKENMDEIEKMNQELKNPEPLEDMSSEEEEIDQNFEKIDEELSKNKRKNSSQQQRNNSQKMKQLGQKLQNMQMNMEMEMMQENMDHLRDITDNLVKLSFKQEELIESFREVRQVDPRFVELSQEQLKLKDDAKVIEDSLLSLASRVVQISSFVTREVGEVNRNIDESVRQLRERNRGKALSSQQFAMTSINNLALLLDDVLQQMQMAMAEAMGKPQKGQKSNQSLPNMKQLQQQLAERIKDLKKQGLKGRELSEEIAKMAAEQEMIRNQLQEMQEKLNGQNGGKEAGDKLGKIIEEMEKNEVDLVNKRITDNLINRQEEIITRMLEAEESLREQELDPNREAQTATNYEKRLPEAFEEYLKAKEKEIELLKTVPLELSPFYKKEVNDYFRRLSKEN
ncbi:MAG: hypothetical protein KI790_02355 [Cyclobacteriaceae bacterium]|nr:hypothetical protein [Cyclobacteriaceae bacterium HetDA_MAG_MS6]